MSTLTFSDGETFDTSVELQLTRRKDGWYVIGNGHLIPVRDIDEGRERLREMKESLIQRAIRGGAKEQPLRELQTLSEKNNG